MSVTACALPAVTLLDGDMVEAAYFRDAYRVPLRYPQAAITDIFLAIFAHHPMWIKRILITRNWLASHFGLEAPSAREMMSLELRSSYRVGDKIGVWPILALSDNELVAGRNNKHLDFRLSVLREADGEAASVVVSTICVVHNLAGKLYLFFIVPFHKLGVRHIMSNAFVAGRL